MSQAPTFLAARNHTEGPYVKEAMQRWVVNFSPASDALYQDHPSAAPPVGPVDRGDEVVRLPFDES